MIWPESAAPYPLDREPEARRLIARVVPPGGLLVTGGTRFDLEDEPPRAWNSLFALDDTGRILARYDKVDLVPFGEFLPFRWALARWVCSGGGTRRLPAWARPATIALDGVPPFSPLVCYEAIFPGAATQERPGRNGC